MTSLLRIKLLGNLQITLDDKPLAVKSRKGIALLVYLAVTGQPHSRAALAALLWRDMPEAKARANLRKALAQLRPKLASYLHISNQAVAFNVAVSYWLDVTHFDRAVQRILNQDIGLQDLERLGPEFGLYHGDFLPDFHVRNAPAFEDWVREQRETVQEQALRAYLHIAEMTTRQQAYETGIVYLRHFLQIQPWQENTHRQLMRLYALNNDRAAALIQYRRCVQALQDELGVPPDSETVSLYEQIAQGSFVAAASKAELLTREVTAVPTEEPIVARSKELRRLTKLFGKTGTQKGNLQFVIGEAGSGKSSLLRAFIREARQRHDNLVVLQGQCNAFSGNGDAYLPFRAMVSQLFDQTVFRHVPAFHKQAGRAAQKASPLDICLEHGPQLLNTFVSAATMLDWAEQTMNGDASGVEGIKQKIAKTTRENLGLNVQQQNLFEQFTTVMGAVSRAVPLVLMIDDLQWADRGSVDLLFHLGRQLHGYPILLLGAYRTEEVAFGLQGQPHPLQAVVYELQRRLGDIFLDLDRVDKRPFINAYLDLEPNQLEEPFRTTLYQQTEGHPLFTVELLRDMQERDELVKNQLGEWIISQSLNWNRLPARVEGVIGERINRLEPALQQILTVACVEGEFFTAEVVAHVLGKAEGWVFTHLSQALDKVHRLVRAEEMVRTVNGRLSTYRFRHILIQKYLYDHLDVIEKGRLHEAVAAAYEQLHDDLDAIANTLATHFQLAGIPKKAIVYLHKAAVNAIHRYAHHEAITLINEALELVKTLPEGQERNTLELDLLITLGPTLLTRQGYAGKDVITTYARAYELNQIVRENPNQNIILSGLWLYYLTKGSLTRAMELAEEFYSFACEKGNIDGQILADFTMVGSHFFYGQFEEAIHYAVEAEILYQNISPQHHQLDYRLSFAEYHAFSLTFLGYLDQALIQSNQGIELNRQIGNPLNLAFALSNAAVLHCMRNEPHQALRLANESIALADEYGFRQALAQSLIIRGWCLVQNGAAISGVQNIEQGLQTWREEMGAELAITGFLWFHAHALGGLGNLKRGLASLNEALQIADRGEKVWLAELYRTKGEFLRQQGETNNMVEQQFMRAIHIAQQQQAKLFELRAVTSLSEFYVSQGRRAEAQSMLQAIVNWFTEGLDTADLQKAVTLLQSLSG